MGKIVVIETAWEMLFFDLMKISTRIKDVGMKHIISGIIQIKPEIKAYIINEYME